MVRLLGLVRGVVRGDFEPPREITPRGGNITTGENGWLIRFFDSDFFCEWIAVSYLYKHDHPGVRDYLCNRMYKLPLSGIENYLFQICYMMMHKPSPSLDKFVTDICSKSLKIALKVHWFLLAELEDSDDSEGISRLQEKCQIAATLMGEWPPLVWPQNTNTPSSPSSKNQVLNRLRSSKQRLLSLTSSPISGINWQDDIGPQSPEDNKLFKKFIPSPKVRDALLFRKSADKNDDDSEKEGFFKRLLRDSKNEDDELTSSSEGFFKRMLSKGEDEESEKDGFFKRLLRDSKNEDEELTSSSEGFFKRLFRDSDDKSISKSVEDEEKEGFFKKIFKDKFEDKKDGENSEERRSKSAEDDEKEGFFRKFLKDKFDDKKDRNDKHADCNSNVDDDEPSDVSLFRVCFPMGKGTYRVVHIPEEEAVLMNSREKAPYLICTEVLKCETPSNTKGNQKVKGGIPLENGDGLLHKPPSWAYPLRTAQEAYRNSTDRLSSSTAHAIDQAAAAKGEAPPGLPLKSAGQDLSDAQPRANGGISKATDALSGELWDVKRERIRRASVYGKLPGWDLRSFIVKSGDDCRQEHLAVQLISHFYDIFQEAGLPLWLQPYEILVTSSYTALIETIPNTASIHSIKSRHPNITSLRDFFIAKYEENSPTFKLAQRNFVESMAGYSLVCYLLQVKDRHNGNLLLDEEGHIIHIDFGFMLSNSPGGVNFESAPFKLTRELLEVMDSDAEGIPSEFFDYFKVLCIQGFLTCRKHAERIILLVEMLQDSGFPCFKGGPRTSQNLRKRFHLSLTEEQCVSLMLSLIGSSLDAWRTRQYDYYQKSVTFISLTSHPISVIAFSFTCFDFSREDPPMVFNFTVGENHNFSTLMVGVLIWAGVLVSAVVGGSLEFLHAMLRSMDNLVMDDMESRIDQ
ncbi:hypothetical protein ACFE04_014342 [Oxalis oulophora]